MRIFVEEKALSYALTKEIISKYPYELIPSYEEFSWELLPEEELINQGKRRLFILDFKGEFLKPCPGTQNYICCGYQIFHIGEGCPLDCSYCILQLYLNRPGIKVWGNLLEDGFPRLKVYLSAQKRLGKVVRLGTGEFTDSLALESITHISEKLIKLWHALDPLALLELKTKVALSEEFFQGLKGDPRIIFAWSVNTEKIIREEERGTASLEARLKSAQLAIQKGFSVAFHFDPIILYEGAHEEYPLILEKILQTIEPSKIVWISLGTLRFPRALKEIAEKRFPESKIYAEEFIQGLDNKARYFLETRKALYRSFKKIISRVSDQVVFYFCMESERVWEEVLGLSLKSSEELRERLDRVAKRLCSL
uniref:DNA photolyase n=1 Tax=Caldimicrobium thiodismutans TaxID=1653476 RepID=A0A832LWE7_9BACT